MPSGDRHLKLEMVLLPLFAGGYYYLDTNWLRLSAFVGAYLLASLMLTPDLDLHNNDARKRWGVLGFIWFPYSKLFKHRGISHSLLFGVLTRVGYLSLLVGGGVAGAYYAGVNIPTIAWTPNWPLIGAAVAGLYTPNVLHVLYDHWDTSRKIRRNRRLARRQVRVSR